MIKIPTKLNYKQVKESFEKEGYTLLSKKYLGVKYKLKYKCPNNHIAEIRYDGWQDGHRCKQCFDERQRKNYNDVKDIIEKEGYILLSEVYKNVNSKMIVACPKGHIFNITYLNWVAGHRCKQCYILYKLKYKYSYIKLQFEKEGYTLLSKEYLGEKYKLKYKCPNNHIAEIKWNDFQQGKRCRKCYELNRTDRYTYKKVKKDIESQNYKLISSRYKNNDSKLKCICPENHICFITYRGWRAGFRCKECSYERKRTKFKDVQKSFEREGYTLLSKLYKNNFTDIKVRCPENHIYIIKYKLWLKGVRCKQCYLHRKREKVKQRLKENFKIIKKTKTYKQSVCQLTKYSYKKYKNLINPENLNRSHKAYHLDHIFSIIDGFKNKISPEIIASPINLRMISSTDNLKKGSNSEFTVEELNRLYYQFNKEVKIQCG